MIIKCPSCSFEQPFEGEYCPNCGGELRKLLAAEKQRKKKEHIKTRMILVSLSSLLFLGYFLIFYGKSDESKNLIVQNEAESAERAQPVKLTPSKIVSRAAAPPIEPRKRAVKRKAVAAGDIRKKPIVEPQTETTKAKALQTDTVVEKSIRNIQLLDRFNCDGLEVKVLLNKDETKNLLECSQVVVSDIGSKETFILEEEEATVSMSLYLSESTLEVIMTILTDDEDEPISYNYFYNLPQTKTSTESVVFPLQLKGSSSKIDELIEDSPVLPLLFKGKSASDSSNWSPLFFHATF